MIRETPVNSASAQKSPKPLLDIDKPGLCGCPPAERDGHLPAENIENKETGVNDADKMSLSSEEDTESPDRDSNVDETTDENKKPEKKTPPIILKDEVNWAILQKNISEAGRMFSAKLVKKIVRIQTDTPNDFRKMTSFLENKKLAFFTNKLPEEKTLKTVIRGIPTSITEQEIEIELLSINLPVLQLRRM